MLTRILTTIGAVALLTMPAYAETEISVYGGVQTAPHSSVSGTRADGTPFHDNIGWEGRSLSMPIYYGARAMWWQPSDIGYGIEVTHAKFYAPTGDMPAGFSRMEFSDGHNIATVNVMKRRCLGIPPMVMLTNLFRRRFGSLIRGIRSSRERSKFLVGRSFAGSVLCHATRSCIATGSR